MGTATVDQISQVLHQRLHGLGLDISGINFPGKSIEREKPYLVVEQVRGGKKNPGISAGGKTRGGYMVVKIINDKGKHANASNALAEAIEQAFPFGLELSCGTAKLRLDKDAETQTGYETEHSYCTPVYVHYIVTGK